MNAPQSLCFLVLFGMGCGQVNDGTFVGNPGLTVEYSDSDAERARGGSLVISELILMGCGEADDLSLDNISFRFENGSATSTVQIPRGEYCGLFVGAESLTVAFDTSLNERVTVQAGPFDLTLMDGFQGGADGRYVLRLADEQWLGRLAAVTVPGLNVVDEGDSALSDAFFQGLQDDSAIVEDENTDTGNDEAPLAGRLNLEDFTFSPSGIPLEVTGCVDGGNALMAVPIPPAAMATLPDGGGEVGWCEGEVTFAPAGGDRQATQLDYSDLSTFSVDYNSWGQSCDALHCNEVFSDSNENQQRPCTVLAVCSPAGVARVVGYNW